MRGLYIHLPFCRKKCSYCDFVSYMGIYGIEDDYINALLAEFDLYRGESIDTVYFGGGTPTSLKTKNLIKLLNGVFSTFNVAQNAEVTVECNPNTADFEKFRALIACGANRLSVGIQSLDDKCLRTIGRIHTAYDASKCIDDAVRAGFLNLSVDLMFGLPGQSLKSVQNSVRGVLAMPNICHVSCYGLILEENTPLWKQAHAGEVTLPDEDTEFEMYCKIKELLQSNGIYQYEISSFAKDGFQSRHNLKYWSCEEYIGCGAAAHSYFNGVRFCHTPEPESYIKNPGARLEEMIISKKEQMSEFMFLGLRKNAGISVSEFSLKFGYRPDEIYKNVIEKFTRVGLLISAGDTLRLSEKGVYVSNTVLCEFV